MSDETQPAAMPAEIAKAIIAASKDIERLAKNMTNDHHGYDYASAESIVAACRPVLLAHGLLVQQESWAVTSDGGWITLSARYRYIHDSGITWCPPACCDIPIYDHAGKGIDKSATTSLTTCLAYFLRGALLLPRQGTAGTGDDVDQRDDRGSAPRTQASRPQPDSDEPRKIKAKFASTCPMCLCAIGVGEMVLWKKGAEAIHPGCRPDAPPEREASETPEDPMAGEMDDIPF